MNPQEHCTHQVIEAFLLDRKSQNLSPKTILFYKYKLKLFTDFCNLPISDVTPSIIRDYLLYLPQQHNAGGVFSAFRALRTFFRWYESEVEPPNWSNPFKKVHPPKVPVQVLEPITLENIVALLNVSDVRDALIFYLMTDCGLRASEMLSIDTVDVDTLRGTILIRQAKGRRVRSVFIGATTRKCIRKYLRQRDDDNQALLVTDDGVRLTYQGLRSMIIRRSKDAHIAPPPPHSFRRFFCLQMLRSGCSIPDLCSLMGHSSYSTLYRYLKLTGEDLRSAHRQGGVDNWL